MSQVLLRAPLSMCVMLCLALSACSQPEQNALPQKPQNIELIAADLTTAELGHVQQKTAFTGTVRAVEQSSLQAQVSATVTEVRVQVGQRVRQGELLLRLNNQDNAARLAQAQANLASAQSQSNLAQSLVTRKKRLYDQGFISKLEYEQAQVDYQGQLENVKAQQANVNIASKAQQDGNIYSPIDGVISKRQVEPGQTVSAGQTVFEIVNPDHLEIQGYLPVGQQVILQMGQTLQYQLQGQTEKLSAKVTRIAALADPINRQIEFFAQPQQNLRSLSIGSFIQGELLSEHTSTGHIIPLSSIHNLEQAPYVWAIRQQKIQKLPVQVLEQRYNEDLAVVGGLNDAELISRVAFADDAIGRLVQIQK